MWYVLQLLTLFCTGLMNLQITDTEQKQSSLVHSPSKGTGVPLTRGVPQDNKTLARGLLFNLWAVWEVVLHVQGYFNIILITKTTGK